MRAAQQLADADPADWAKGQGALPPMCARMQGSLPEPPSSITRGR